MINKGNILDLSQIVAKIIESNGLKDMSGTLKNRLKSYYKLLDLVILICKNNK